MGLAAFLAVEKFPYPYEGIMELNWQILPPELHYLIPAAEKYGVLQFDEEIYEFMFSINDNQRQELREVAQRMLGDEKKIDAFLDAYRMTTHNEARQIYFLGHLIALLNDSGIL